jgi:integrase/recombinase XerD
LRAGTDTSVIALWLGHEDAETTQVYLHADMTIKEQALARVQQPGTSPGRYRPPDTLLTFLNNLWPPPEPDRLCRPRNSEPLAEQGI